MIKAALVGNPNSGKTTLFNRLTGARLSVGNWPGVTVECTTGVAGQGMQKGKAPVTLVDLPGVYSLSPYSPEERISRDFLLTQHYDVILNVVDADNLERNLYLTLQLLELERPVVVAANMMDVLRAKGKKLDIGLLSKALGCPVVPISARSGENITRLMATVQTAAREGKLPLPVRCDREVENALSRIEEMIPDQWGRLPGRFLAWKLLAGDKGVEEDLDLTSSQRATIQQMGERLAVAWGAGDRATLAAMARYRVVAAVGDRAMTPGRRGRSFTHRIDSVATHPLLALPLFGGLMLGMFWLTFGPPGRFLQEAMGSGVDTLRLWLEALLTLPAVSPWARNLLLDGIYVGVAGVVTFLPQMLLLFLCLALLEDSGYMARAAFLLDRPLRGMGLCGRSFIPMLLGFGCTTSAVMAARTIENERSRRMTVLLTPFMSCGAKLPVYLFFTGLFFPRSQLAVIFALYAIGVGVAVFYGFLLQAFVFQGAPAPFVMELPPYRMPTMASIGKQVWRRCRDFLDRAGSVIFAMSVVVWALRSFTPDFRLAMDDAQSVFGRMGAAIAPVFAPLGFGGWQAAVSLLSGIVAKEGVVTTLQVLYGNTLGGVPQAVTAAFTPLSAFSYMVFCLLYMPCVSAFASIRREMGSVWWTIATLLLTTGTAYGLSLAVYQLGRWFGLG